VDQTNNLDANNKDLSNFSAKTPTVFYGGDYNPDQWPEEVWLEDVQLMREARVNLVSLGIFSWARLEPVQGQYDFDWLDRIMNLLHRNGVMVDLATATASPPAWLALQYPESLPVTKDGTTLWPGSRQQYCPHSKAYREAAALLVSQIATRYRNHPALVMWHINNEYACHVSECFCDASAAAFREWLRQRYGSLERLNDAWGTSFWSQHYADWAEINPPRTTPTQINPTQQLDWQRFCSDSILECFQLERDILRGITPAIPVTTNFMGFFKPLDYWKWAGREDIVSDDAYPDPSDSTSHVDTAMRFDLMRSLGQGKSWILMEQVTSQVNWRPQNVLKRPGQMRMWSYQAVARGANGIMFFQWRASRSGAEKFHGALVPHVGTTNSRVWREVKQLGQELSQLSEVLYSRVTAEVAILMDWESWWALEIPSKPSTSISFINQVKAYYAPLFAKNIPVDFVSPESDLSKYRVVLLPNLYLVKESTAQRLNQFVAGGGKLVMSFFSGIVNEEDHIYLGCYPAPFREMLGIRVEEFDPYVPGQTNSINLAGYGEYKCELWSDVIDLEGAEALATYGSDFYAGKPALTRYHYGKGVSYYLGTQPEAAAMSLLLARVCAEAGVKPTLAVPEGVEVVRRETGDSAYLFLINHNNTNVEITLDQPASNLLSQKNESVEAASLISLEGYGVAILASKISNPGIDQPVMGNK
jgi:beta-galactosidase